ncbi:MAG: Asp23/Gls24 family envelope stress response protein [Planctomycetota bacterium]
MSKKSGAPGEPETPEPSPASPPPGSTPEKSDPKLKAARKSDQLPALPAVPTLQGAFGDTVSGRELEKRGLDSTGRTSIEDPVFFEIAYREARSIPGVVDVKGSFFEMLTGHGKGIHVKTSDTAVILELRLALEYGRFIPDVVMEVRKRISVAIKRMTDREVRSIKVTIDRLVEGFDGEATRLDHDEDTEHIDF